MSKSSRDKAVNFYEERIAYANRCRQADVVLGQEKCGDTIWSRALSCTTSDHATTV